ncbi:hypothetical protein IMG5_117930 [Ichthyophthirius multifiliis]|uniref:Uncharacterized protein n=1 Tax=Ichthyophthirius multifiliis TaxID=5932 RepID=G0QUM2_ICHMU|nr:hypothetical protein IMG5_117930 [Ichthyophthirius multifiliis]EGR31068.1 hypothetical protein IMG5_117930 [Ichthyophthirius multifiliis]|eukprot:XP_004034554.1 hypothetical protein IMG5_117930 [Ichthyophthirius multifiliis]
MDIVEQIGFIHFWGLSPAINFIDKTQKGKQSLNVLLVCTSDIRHILKTIADNLTKNDQLKELNIYVYEKEKEVTCRMILLMQILQTYTLNYKERIELYLDVFGNCLIREKTQLYINEILPTLINLINNENKKTSTPLKKLFDFSEIKYKEIDDLTNILNLWHSKIPFEMEKHRDQRLRYHYKERYDFRTNLIDWDYQMGLKEQASIIHFIHYRDWRQTGVAYESGFSSYIIPNRTLSSYLPGKKKIPNKMFMQEVFGEILLFLLIFLQVQNVIMNQKKLNCLKLQINNMLVIQQKFLNIQFNIFYK